MSKLQQDLISIRNKIKINDTTLTMVGKICTVCRSCSFVDKDLSFFTYPGDPLRRYEWLKAVKRLDLLKKLDDDKTRGNHRICEIHFETRFIQKSRLCEGRKFLTKDAFPTLCLSPFNKGIPIMTDNFLKPRKPIPILNAPQIIIRKKPIETLKQNDYRPKQEPVVQRRYNLRPVKVKIQQEEDSEDEDDDINNKVPYQGYKRPISPPIYEDASQFCESLMQVSQSTQTIASLENNKLLEDTSTSPIIGQDVKFHKDLPQFCSKFLSPSLARLFKLKAYSATGRNVNFTLFALNLYYSTNMYNFLSNMLSLPSQDTLKYYILPKTTQVNEQFLNAFRCKVSNMSAKEKVCCFSVGSVSLTPSLYYDIKHDRIIGFHDINGVQNTGIAKYAILLMVQGILEDWQQPIAYSFISGYENLPEISLWIDEILTLLIEIGLDVRAFVADPRSEFLYASDTRLVTPDKTSFTINDKDIFYTYDTLQLLRIVKNNLKSCDFFCSPNFQNSNNEEFFDKINDLCNLLNAKTLYSNFKYKRAFSNKKYQSNFLNDMLYLFKNLKVLRKADGIDVTENMKFIESFQISINSVQQLFKQLHFLGARYLITSRLTHQGLNNFFAQVKQIESKNGCTPKQFNKTFVRRFVFNALKKPVSRDSLANSLDVEEYAQKLLDKEVKEFDNGNQPLFVNTTDYRDNLPAKNVFVYICGYCYQKCIQMHECDTFLNYIGRMKHGNGDEEYLCTVSLDLNGKNSKMSPPDDFTEFLLFLEYKFNEFFKRNNQMTNVGQEIMQEMADCDFEMPCPCFPIDYLKSLFVRVRLYYTIRKNNTLIKKKKGVKTFRVISL